MESIGISDITLDSRIVRCSSARHKHNELAIRNTGEVPKADSW